MKTQLYRQAGNTITIVFRLLITFCLTMKIITLEKVLEALKEEKYEVVVDKEIAAKARVGIQKMLDLS